MSKYSSNTNSKYEEIADHIPSYVPNTTCAKLPRMTCPQSCNYCRICNGRPRYDCQYACINCQQCVGMGPSFYDRFPVQPDGYAQLNFRPLNCDSACGRQVCGKFRQNMKNYMNCIRCRDGGKCWKIDTNINGMKIPRCVTGKCEDKSFCEKYYGCNGRHPPTNPMRNACRICP